MTDGDPRPNNPLSPYYPSDVPDVPGNGRTWFALLIVLVFFLGAVYQVVVLLT